MECPSCLFEFEEPSKVPRILTCCGQSVCEECISSLIDSDSLTCPGCGKASPGSSVTSFPTNLALLQLKKTSSSSSCKIHNKAIEAFCATDKKLLCVSCILDQGHKTHDILSMPKAAAKHREVLNTLLNNAYQNENLLLKGEVEIESQIKTVQDQFSKIIEEFGSMYEALREGINLRESEMVLKLSQCRDEEIKNLESKRAQQFQGLKAIDEFKAKIQNIENESELLIINNFAERESLGKKACAKVQLPEKTDAFSSFSKEIEASYFWKLVKQTFSCVPKARPVKQTNNEEQVPLALANAAFSKDLRSSRLDKKSSKNSKGDLRKSNTLKATVQPAKQRAPRVVKKTLTLNKEEYEEPRHESDDELSLRSFDLASLCRAPEAFIYTFGGFSDKSLTSIERYDCGTDKWELLGDIPTPRTQFGVLQHSEDILLIGGKQANKRTALSEVYCRADNSWKPGNINLPTARSGFGHVKIADDFYFIGGSDGIPLKTFEMWNGDWNELPSLKNRRDELGAAVGPDLNIYAIGGYGGPDMSCLKSAERFNLETNSWEVIAEMSTPKRSLSCVTLPDGIYSIGGYDGSKYLRSLEKYDIRTGKWVSLAPMKHARCTFSAVASADCQFIYAIGGFNGSAVCSVERYSIVEDKWTELPSLNESRFMHNSILFSD